MPSPEMIKPEKIENKGEILPEQIKNAQRVWQEFLNLKSEEKIALLGDNDTNPQILEIIRKSLAGRENVNDFTITDKTTRKELNELMATNDVVLNLSLHDKTTPLYDEKKLKKYNYRMMALLDSDPEIFKDSGAFAEPRRVIEERLGRMEEVLNKAYGFRISTSYGTNLNIGLRRFRERKWQKSIGAVEEKGKWDNGPGGSIYTTPDEMSVNGILVLPALDSEITKEQGVDDFVRLEIKDGIIISIQGGKSAEKLRKLLAADMKMEKKENENPDDVLRVCQLCFGANSKARGRVGNMDKSFKHKGVSTVEAVASYGGASIGFGDAKHGDEGSEGFTGAEGQYIFTLPRQGLTVEMFTSEKDFGVLKNGRKIISGGNINYYDA